MRYDQQDHDDMKTWEVIAASLITAVLLGMTGYIALRVMGRLP